MVNRLSKSSFISNEFPFYIGRFQHTGLNSPSDHSHDFVELVYFEKGKAEHVFEGNRYPIYAGDVFIINPGEIHSYVIDPDDQIEIINCLFLPELFHETMLQSLGISQSMDYFYVHPFLDDGERFHHRLNLSSHEAKPILHILESMMDEQDQQKTGYRPFIKLQLLELLLLLSRYYSEKEANLEQQSEKDERKVFVTRIHGFLERHYDQKLSIPHLSQVFNISHRHLNRIFKQETGQTVTERIHQIRIDRAKLYLIDSDDKVIHIAMRVGYEDPSFFSQLFRRQVGCSPGKYREMHKRHR